MNITHIQLFSVLMTHAETVDEVRDKLVLNWIPSLILRNAISILFRLRQEGYGWDSEVLRVHLEKEHDKEAIETFFSHCYSAVGSVNAIYSYIEIIEEDYRVRLLRSGLSTSLADLNDGNDIDAVLSTINTSISNVEKCVADDSAIHFTDAVALNLTDMEEVLSGTKTLGLQSGYTQIDDNLGGYRDGDYVIIAGRPSHGKTTYLLNIIKNCTYQSTIPFLFFSLEMPKTSISENLMSNLSGVPIQNIRNVQLSDTQWGDYSQAVASTHEYNIIIDDDMTPVEDICRKARAHKRKFGQLLAVGIDYVQLLTARSVNTDSRNVEMTEISRQLKALAKELECPIFALSQLNRSLEQRADKRPMNSDLRESGSLEQDADIIQFVYRPEMYQANDRPGESEVIIGKARKANIGVYNMQFLGQYARINEIMNRRANTQDISSPQIPQSEKPLSDIYSKSEPADSNNQQTGIDFINN